MGSRALILVVGVVAAVTEWPRAVRLLSWLAEREMAKEAIDRRAERKAGG